jgi:hypothetical protein
VGRNNDAEHGFLLFLLHTALHTLPRSRLTLLLHLGDVLEATACVMKCTNRFNTVGEAVGQEESLMSFSILRMVDAEMTPYEFAKRAASAFFRGRRRCSKSI